MKLLHCSLCGKYLSRAKIQTTVPATAVIHWYSRNYALAEKKVTAPDIEEVLNSPDMLRCDLGHAVTVKEVEQCPHPEWQEDLRPAGDYWHSGSAMGHEFTDKEVHAGPYRRCLFCGLKQKATEKEYRDGNIFTRKWIFENE